MGKSKNKKKFTGRDSWIPETWRYNGAGFQKNQKKIIPRNQKHRSIGGN